MELEELKKLTEQGEREFKKRAELIKDLVPFVWIPSFICPAGSFYYERENDREPNDIDIIVRAEERGGSYFLELDKSLRLKVDRILQKRVKKQTGKWIPQTEWVDSTYGPNWRYQTGWDLVLKPHEPQEIVEMDEPEFADEFYKISVNSPTFAYYAVYDKWPDTPLAGRTDMPKRMWNNIEVDEHFKDKWLKELNSIPEIEIRSSDEGKSDERVAFIVFRMEDSKDDSRVQTISDKLNKIEGLYSKYNLGKEERPRVVVAGKVKYGDENWEEWWDSLAGRIKEVLKDEFSKQRHSREKCMQCNKPPVYEVLWAEGMAHAWFCKEHFKGWVSQESKEHTGGFDDVDYVKEVKGGVASKKFSENSNPNIKEQLKREFEKLHLEEFKRTGLDEDLRNPKGRHAQLFAGLRYLGNGAYPKIGLKGAWKEWTREDILKYYAKIVDKLRSVYFPVTPPKIGDKEFNTSYWKCYRASKKYMKSTPPKKDEVKEWDEKRKEIIKRGIEFNFKKVEKTEYIVGGVVYRSKKLDAQEDFARETEVWKALKKYMIKKKHIKVMHKGKLRDIPIVENYFVEEQHHKGGSDDEHLLEKGDWWLSTYLGDSENRDIWADVKSGKLQGFSMAGKAHQFSTSYLGD